MTLDLQRKYRYSVSIVVKSTKITHKALVDEFTPPDLRAEPVTRQNAKLGQITLTGPRSYGEMSMRLALRIGSDSEASESQNLIAALEDLSLSDIDTCDITLTLNALKDAHDIASYRQLFSNCRLTGFKLDPLGRKDDSDFVHLEISLIPSKVLKVEVEG